MKYSEVINISIFESSFVLIILELYEVVSILFRENATSGSRVIQYDAKVVFSRCPWKCYFGKKQIGARKYLNMINPRHFCLLLFSHTFRQIVLVVCAL